ncbi:MAG: CotH kinase family protein [Cryomorphaceae bacterium]|nr:CotH kinase family protein [Cryomorphaceae bacterium]
MRTKIFLVLMLVSFFAKGQQSLVINEVSHVAFQSVEDEDGDFPNWVEFYNPTATAISLNGFYLSPAANDLLKYPLPDTILFPGDFLLVLCSGKNRIGNSYIHANFELRDDMRRLFFSGFGNIDTINFPALPYDHSFGRAIDGGDSLVAFAEATPGKTNQGANPYFPLNEDIFAWPFSGFFPTDSLRVEISGSKPGIEFYYTLDGTIPSTTDYKYDGALWLFPPDSFHLAKIPTNPPTTLEEYVWKPPRSMQKMGRIFSARGFCDGKPCTPVVFRHYFLQKNAPDHNLGVASIITDPDGFFGFERGIYVPGKVHADNPETPWPWGTGNYHERGRRWEREVNMAFFEPNGDMAFQQNLGVRIHGMASRTLPMKSLRLYPRSIYGPSRINYDFFGGNNTYNRILFRNSGQGFNEALFGDALASIIARKMGMEAQDVRPIIHFVNGEFWGVINVRNRIDEEFIEQYTGVPKNDVVISRPIDFSNDPPWQNLVNTLKNTSTLDTDTGYAWLGNQLDIDNLIDYLCFRVYSGVHDWPGNNRMIWRNKNNGLYRNIVFDSDGSFRIFERNTLEHALATDGPGWPNPPWSTLLFRKSLENEKFRNQFLNRMEELMATQFHPKILKSLLDSMVANYRDVMPHQIDRWGYPITDMSVWFYHVSVIKEFFDRRPCYIREFFMNRFDLEDDFMASFECDKSQKDERFEQEDLKMKIFPNPTDNVVTLGLKLDAYQRIRIYITNPVGQVVYHFNQFVEKHELILLISEMENFPPGPYVLTLQGRDAVLRTKIIKQ